MTYALSLILLMATAQTAGQPAAAPAAVPVATPPAAPTATPAALPAAAPAAPVVVQCPPSDSERMLRAKLDDARRQRDQMRSQLERARRKAAAAKEQLAKVREESGMPDHAIAALLVSDRPGLAPLKRVSWRSTGGGGRWRIRSFDMVVYSSRDPDETMAAVVVTLRNPREAPTWELKEAFLRPPFYTRQDVPVPVAVRSSPERIRPGETARVALVFDTVDVDFDEGYAKLELLRDGKFETAIDLRPADFQVASAMSGGAQ